MQLSLTQKERTLLQDQKNHEVVCIQKYSGYAQQAQDPQLKQLFSQYASQEQEHYNTIDQMLQGQQPSTSSGQAQQQQKQPVPSSAQSGSNSQQEALFCNDMLMAEKYVSGAYDTAIFESANPTVRQALQHIQKEEQQHGEGLFNYMYQHGMYNP